MNNKKERTIVVVMVTLIIIATVGLIQTIAVHASTLSLEAPPPPALFLNSTEVNLTADDKDRDISIDPSADLPANGTQTISTTTGATDVDINEFPPIGVTVLIQNGTVTVTNHTVDVYTDLEEEAAQQAIESNDDDGDSDSDEE
jgi:hypothetical protein